MGFCPNCGKEVSSAAVYCPNCGHQLGVSATTPQAAESVEPYIDNIEVFHPNKDMTVYVTDKKIRIDARKHAKDYHTRLIPPFVGGFIGTTIEDGARSSIEKLNQKKANAAVAGIGSSEEGVAEIPYEAISEIVVNRKGFTINKVDGRSAQIKLPKEELHHFIQTINGSKLASKLKVE